MHLPLRGLLAATALVATIASASAQQVGGSPPPSSWEIAGQFNPDCPGNAFGQPWTYGQKPVGGGTALTPLNNTFSDPYTSTNAPIAANNTQVAGCRTSPSVPFPYVGHLRQTRIRDIATVNGPYSMAARAMLLHPGPSGEMAVVRFTAPLAGKYCISGRFYGTDGNGTKTTTRVSIQSVTGGNTLTQLWAGTIDLPNNFNAATFTTTSVQLLAGEHIDFEVDMGLDYFFDTTGLHGVIELAYPLATGQLSC